VLSITLVGFRRDSNKIMRFHSFWILARLAKRHDALTTKAAAGASVFEFTSDLFPFPRREDAVALATFCSRVRPNRAVRRPACGNERPMERASVGPHGALAWSRISIDIARVRSGSLNSMHRVGASCETRRGVRARNEKYRAEC